ncbi:unnamed protein product [Pleuronectes platessa]|uniref:Uncharacterized protein n=1 Tax=Pleuronectes platessa TaxID=8262 RepID=A0A9N7UR05_PLEPL|nr:unnamed protein product [Pleuronectes platessa]
MVYLSHEDETKRDSQTYRGFPGSAWAGQQADRKEKKESDTVSPGSRSWLSLQIGRHGDSGYSDTTDTEKGNGGNEDEDEDEEERSWDLGHNSLSLSLRGCQ